VLKQQIWQYEFNLTTSENKPDQAGEDLTNEETYSSHLNTKWPVRVWAWKLVDSMLTGMTVLSDESTLMIPSLISLQMDRHPVYIHL